MKIGIMQPYFWPYLGYFQLMNAVDKYVIYDNIEYTKKGWFNRNRYLCNGTDKYFTIPIAKDSDYLDVIDRKISKNFNRDKLMNQIKMAYIKAPYFKNVFPIFCDCIECNYDNLFNYIYYSIKTITAYLKIKTEIIKSSATGVGHELKGQDKVIAICNELKASEYVNAIGGESLYDKEEFKRNGIQLSFLKMDDIRYTQFNNDFISGLSILDVLMFNSVEEVAIMLTKYRLK